MQGKNELLLHPKKEVKPMADYRNNSNLVRGLRDNNPLNIKPAGFSYQNQIGVDDIGEGIFTDTIYGLRAAALDLYTAYYVHGRKTLTDIISVFAPASDGNDVNAYINYVSDQTGIDPNADIGMNGDVLFKVMRAMANMELGESNAAIIPDQDFITGIQSANKAEIAVITVAAVGTGGVILIVILIFFIISRSKKKKAN